MRAISATLVLLLLFLSLASLHDLAVAGDGAAVPDGVCDGKCRSRCSLKKAGRCMGLCMMCCGKCSGCVPSGPYASKDECPCYRDMVSPKTRRPKCP
ncbi:hypothetical protein ACP4OV_019019 [Aristida adscensionis]